VFGVVRECEVYSHGMKGTGCRAAVDSAAGSGDLISNWDLRMPHMFLYWGVGVARRFAERVLDGLATV
jgi:hypothetical protein